MRKVQTLYKGNYFEHDMKKLEWLIEKYSDVNIADSLHFKISIFLRTVRVKEKEENFEKLNNIEKAISQDIKKCFYQQKKFMIIQ